MTKFSNPRMEATIDGWPIGSKRTTAHFVIECTPKGERGTRYDGALPLRSVWVGRKPPRRLKPLVRWWLRGAMLVLASAVIAVAVVRILRAGML
jgi:hypothetical protein